MGRVRDKLVWSAQVDLVTSDNAECDSVAAGQVFVEAYESGVVGWAVQCERCGFGYGGEVRWCFESEQSVEAGLGTLLQAAFDVGRHSCES